MWALDNRTPFKAAKAWSRDHDGSHEWLVALKAVFDIRHDGSLALAPAQLEPSLLPEYFGEAGASSLKYDCDVVAPKQTTDVIVNGTAYAPGGRPSSDFSVALRVASIHKSLRVRGRRHWEASANGVIASGMQPVASVPLRYEHAYGGFDCSDPDPSRQRLDSRNPVGRGLTARDGEPLPCIEYPTGNIEENGPAGFGAIDSFWSPRRECSGTYDERWRRERFPLLPADWDARALLCAPRDQQPQARLSGGETIELVNLTADGLLRFTLPTIPVRLRTRIDGRIEDYCGHLGTVVIEPDERKVMLVWQSALAVRGNGDYLDETIITAKVQS